MLRDILLEWDTNTLCNIVSHPSLQLALDRSHLHWEFHRATNADFSRTIGSIWKASLLHPTQSFSVSWPMSLVGSPIKYFSYDVVVEASLFLISLLMPGSFFAKSSLNNGLASSSSFWVCPALRFALLTPEWWTLWGADLYRLQSLGWVPHLVWLGDRRISLATDSRESQEDMNPCASMLVFILAFYEYNIFYILLR